MGGDLANIQNNHPQQPYSFLIKMSPQELEHLQDMIRERKTLRHPHLCIVNTANPQLEQVTGVFCQTMNQVVINYEPFDRLLYDLKNRFPLPARDIQRIIYAVCSALQYLYGRRSRHGDVNSRKICVVGEEWKLIDNYFIRGGITAYEKILEGDQGFISPSQMERIRHGFIRESPPIEESDDIFALGMTCLQLMTGRNSMLCYKESHLRFNEPNFQAALSTASQNYPPNLIRLVNAMLNFTDSRRAKIRDILQYPCVAQHASRPRQG